MTEKRQIIIAGGLLCGWVDPDSGELDTLESDRDEVIYKAAGGTQRLIYRKHHVSDDGIDVFRFAGYAECPKKKTGGTVD